MADSEAVRSRRKRMHKAGDHSLCRRCAAVSAREESPGTVTVAPFPAPAEAELDPAAEMRRLARRLAVAYEADTSNALLARELRMTLAELMPKGKGQPDADLTGLFSALQA